MLPTPLQPHFIKTAKNQIEFAHACVLLCISPFWGFWLVFGFGSRSPRFWWFRVCFRGRPPQACKALHVCRTHSSWNLAFAKFSSDTLFSLNYYFSQMCLYRRFYSIQLCPPPNTLTRTVLELSQHHRHPALARHSHESNFTTMTDLNR